MAQVVQLVQLFNDLTSSTASSEMSQNCQTMYDNNLTFDEQVEIFCQLVRETQERTILTTDEGNRVKGRLIDAMIDNFIIPMCNKIKDGMSNIPSPLSTNPDDYIWTFYATGGFGIFDGDFANSYGYRGDINVYAKMKTSIPTFNYDTMNGFPRALASATNSLVYAYIHDIYIRSDISDPFSYRYFDNHGLTGPQSQVTNFFYNTGTQTKPVLFDKVIGWILTPAAFEIVRENPSGKEDATSGKYPSSEMGGLGTFDDTTDLSDISSKPSLNIADLGFFSLWNPTETQLRQLADYVWNDPTNVSQWPQIFQSGILKPLDYIMSLSLFPLSPTQMSLASKTFCMGGIVFDGRLAALGKSITMNQITEQIVDVDMGTLSLKEYFGSFLDYAPYSQVSLYLPYYQTVQLSMNELQNADSINIRYRINLLDGSTSIKVHIDRQTSASQNGSVPMKHVLYEFFTNLKTEIPLTSGQNTEQLKMLATVLCGAAAVVAAPVAGAGASALAGATEGAATIGGMEGASIGAQVGNQAVGQAVSGAIKTGAQGAQKMVNSLPSGGGIQRGNIGGMNNGLLSERRPFLIVTRPIQVLPLNYQNMEGYPASINTTLTNLGEGFVQCESVDLTGLTATASEKGTILEALKGGVFI